MLADSEILTHQTLLGRMAKARAETDKLFDLIAPTAWYARPIRERHRLVFYRGHLEAFDWNLFQTAVAKIKPFDPALDRLFAFGIDPIESSGLPSDQPSDWPEYEQVERYAARIRQELDRVLENDAPELLLHVAIEHRLMHAETLAYMLHQLPYDQKAHQQQPAVPETGQPDFGMLEIPAGTATLGLPRGSSIFGWDNEFDAHRVDVPAFAIDRYKITNAQYLQFLAAGGYRQRELWTASAWEWKTERGIEHPAFWVPNQTGWYYLGMFEEIPLPPHWPVYVSHAEASAYCAWARKRLPTEAEWHRATYGSREGNQREYPWGCELRDSELRGCEPPAPKHGYLDFTRWDPWPVHSFPASASAFGARGTIANGWEWTSTLFAPFAGFKPFPFYEGYSANFFDGMHYVLKGGSPRTDRCMLRRSFRNWFQPQYQYVYAGFRCAS